MDVTLGNTREKLYLGSRLMGKLLLKHIIPHTYSIEFMKKHNRFFIYIILGFLVGLLNSCIIPDVGVSCICLRNKTDKPIACYRTDGTFGISYPDIIFPWDDATDVQKLRVNVMDWEYLMCGRARNDYHWFWNTQQNVLSFYIFDQEKVDSLGWETIIANNDYLVRYDVTPEDISSLIYDKECEGCCLDYPPSPSMKGIRMSPPYEEVIANAKKKY